MDDNRVVRLSCGFVDVVGSWLGFLGATGASRFTSIGGLTNGARNATCEDQVVKRFGITCSAVACTSFSPNRFIANGARGGTCTRFFGCMGSRTGTPEASRRIGQIALMSGLPTSSEILA